MNVEEPVYIRLPKVQIWRRGVAFAIDYLVVSLVASVVGGAGGKVTLGQMLLFLFLWLGMRAIAPLANRGQSLGRWALDMKVVDWQGRTPLLVDLLKREAIAGAGSAFAMLGLSQIAPGQGVGMLFLLPLAIDCSVASTDLLRRQAFHDRIAGTLVVATRRGFSLDLKVRKWYLLAQQWIEDISHKNPRP